MFVTPNQEIRIAQGSTVALHFSVALENGKELDNTRNREEPVTLVIGDGSLLPQFEESIMGLRAGDRRSVHLQPQNAFGEHNPENVQTFDKHLWVKANQEPEVGMMMEFMDQGQGTLYGVISHISDDKVTVDFNHPLAGKAIVFEVEIFKVTPEGEQGVQL